MNLANRGLTKSGLAISVARCMALAIGAALVSSQALAQSSAGEAAAERQSDGLEPIIVTAQKRAQNLQDVGVSVTALGSDALKMISNTDTASLTAAVPSLQVQQYSPSLTVFNVRGVSQNDFSDNQEGPIAFYNDEVYVGALGAIAGQTFDLERVEVLRGPQGTLFGRNATGGLIQVVTARPTKTWQGFATLGAGSHSQVTGEGAVSGPLSDAVRVRLSATADYHDGYYKNAFPGVRDGLNSRFYAIRGQVEFDVGSGGKLNLKAEYLRNDDESANGLTGTVATIDNDGLGVALDPAVNFYGACAGCNPLGYKPGSNPFRGNMNFPGRFDRKYWNLTARYEQDLGFADLTSITNYQNLDKIFDSDVDGSPASLLEVGTAQDLYQISQELRLSRTTDSFNWVAGVYGLKIKTDITSLVFFDPVIPEFFGSVPIGTFATDNSYDTRQKTESLAVFGQGEYKLNDIFSFTLGGRYSADWKAFDFTHAVAYTGFGQTSRTVDYPFTDKQKFEDWSGKVQIDARLNPNALVYISANRGTKSGGYNLPNTVPNIVDFLAQGLDFPAASSALAAALAATDQRMRFGKEVLTSYEAGYKLTLADRHATLNGALFHYDYKGYQSFQRFGAASFVINRPAKVTGMEVEATARPVAGLNLSAFATHLFQAKVEDVQLPGPAGDGTGRIVDRKMPQAPKWSIGGSASLDVPVDRLGIFTLSTNWKYDSVQYFNVYNSPIARESSRVIGNVRLALRPGSDRWEAAFFVSNVTNKKYRVFNSDNAVTTMVEDVYGRPRWFGGSMTYRFGG